MGDTDRVHFCARCRDFARRRGDPPSPIFYFLCTLISLPAHPAQTSSARSPRCKPDDCARTTATLERATQRAAATRFSRPLRHGSRLSRSRTRCFILSLSPSPAATASCRLRESQRLQWPCFVWRPAHITMGVAIDVKIKMKVLVVCACCVIRATRAIHVTAQYLIRAVIT
jgi:hypothetical protein